MMIRFGRKGYKIHPSWLLLLLLLLFRSDKGRRRWCGRTRRFGWFGKTTTTDTATPGCLLGKYGMIKLYIVVVAAVADDVIPAAGVAVASSKE